VGNRTVRRVAWGFLVVNVLAVIWPGLTPVNRVEPKIFGLPLVMVWLGAWIVATLLVLVWIEHRLHGLTGPGDEE